MRRRKRFTCFTSTKVQILMPEAAKAGRRKRESAASLTALIATATAGSHFTCFTSTKVQILTPPEARAGTQFTCFTSIKVQILTPEAAATAESPQVCCLKLHQTC